MNKKQKKKQIKKAQQHQIIQKDKPKTSKNVVIGVPIARAEGNNDR